MKKILLVEDEINVVSFIKKGLTEENFEVSVALDGNSGIMMASDNIFDLIILDIMLPDTNGIEVCKTLRNKNIQTPILFLTALNTVDNIAHGLNAGADDYLVKPFKFIEFVARIKALLRRSSATSNENKNKENIYTIANLKVNDDAKTVERNGELISLTATEYRLLFTLIQNKGRVLSRVDLLESAWDINFNLATNVVDVYINYLRKKIDSNHESKLIGTVIGMGYVLKESMKTQLKIALVLILTNVIMLLLLGGSIYYFLYNYSYTDFYKRLETRAKISAKYHYDADKIDAQSFKKIREENLEKLSEERDYRFEISQETDLKTIAQSTNLPFSYLSTIFKSGHSTLQLNETFYTGIRYKSHNKQYIVIVSAKNYYASHHLIFMRNIILVAVFLIVIFITSLSFYFSKHIFDPIKNIADSVKQISTENIHLRIEEKNNDKEISQLISTFNDLLNRLETAFETQKNFVSNASHEFGTPLTSIMGEAEVILMKERTPEEYQQSLTSILGQAKRLNQITQTLLYLAQTGYSNKKVNFEILRTDELLWQAKEMIDKLNPRNNIIIDFSLLPENPLKLKVMGNKQLLYLAFTNILSNACKYSNNKAVNVSIASSDNQVFLIIKDQGIGIPEAEIQFIYDPFFRASNTRHFEGYGIGLPLTRNIIKIHNGQLLVSSIVNEGTTVQIKLPLANIQKY